MLHACPARLCGLQAWEPAHKALPSRRFVSGSKDGTIRVWDADTRRCVLTASSHTLAVSAHLRLLCGGGPNPGPLGVLPAPAFLAWRAPLLGAGAQGRCPPVAWLQVSCVKWGGEGLIYSGSKDTTINVWDAGGQLSGSWVAVCQDEEGGGWVGGGGVVREQLHWGRSCDDNRPMAHSLAAMCPHPHPPRGVRPLPLPCSPGEAGAATTPLHPSPPPSHCPPLPGPDVQPRGSWCVL
jgi:hypothetical protein